MPYPSYPAVPGAYVAVSEAYTMPVIFSALSSPGRETPGSAFMAESYASDRIGSVVSDRIEQARNC